MTKKISLFGVILCLVLSLNVYAEEIDLISMARQAQWYNSDRASLVFGMDGGAKGTVRFLEKMKMEDGKEYEGVLLTHPSWKKSGEVTGMFLNIRIPEAGGKLIIAGGFPEGTNRTDGVTFSAAFTTAPSRAVSVQRGGAGSVSRMNLCSFQARYDNRVDWMECDLSRIAGQTGIIMLTVNAGNTADFDTAIWTEARLVSGEEQPPAQAQAQVEHLKTLQGHGSRLYSAAFSPDGRYVVTASGDSTAKVWDTSSGNLVFDSPQHAAHVFQANISPDNRVVGTAGADYARLWYITGRDELRRLAGHTDRVNAVAFAPAGNRLATGSSDGTVRIWDWTSQSELQIIEITDGEVYSVAFNPDGRRIAVGGPGGLVGIWNADNGGRMVTMSGHSRAVSSVSFNRSGNRLVTASMDNSAKVWDAGNGAQILNLGGQEFFGAAFSPDGKYILTGNNGGLAVIWRASDGKQVLTIRHADYGSVRGVGFSPDGQHIVTGGENAEAKIWKVTLPDY